jgi:hypothetical protein
MTVLDDIRELILRISPQTICDDCIAENLSLSVRQHANHKTRELASHQGFFRCSGRCDVCHKEKLVIWHI